MAKKRRSQTTAAGAESSRLSVDHAALVLAIEAQRRKLFKAQAIMLTLTHLFHREHNPQEGAPDPAYALEAANDLVDGAVSGLDPLALGL